MIIRIFVIIFVIFCIIAIIKNNQMFSTEQDLKINLEKELKQGNFLIGLKQYLGGENDSFSFKKNINFL